MVLATVSAGIAAEVFFGLREKAGELIAAEGLGCLLGAPGVVTLSAVLGQAAGGALGAVGASLAANRESTPKDKELNHDLARASGSAIASVIRDQAPRKRALRRKRESLEELARRVEEAHEPEVLAEASGPAVPVDPAQVLQEPAGFLKAIALDADAWERYLRELALRHDLPLHVFGSNVRAVAEVLETAYTDALYRALKTRVADDKKAFAGAVLRLLDTTLKRIDHVHRDLGSTAEATWKAVLALREDLDVGRLTAAVDALQRAETDHGEVLTELRATFASLPERLDRLEALQREMHGDVRDGFRKMDSKLDQLLARDEAAKRAGDHSRSNIPPPTHCSFHGRATLLEGIAGCLGDPGAMAVCVLFGPPGVGKSELAREYARRNARRYRGGTWFVEIGEDGRPDMLLHIAKSHLRFTPDANYELDDQCLQVLAHLERQRVLLVYDGVGSHETVAGWLPAANSACHVLITTNADTWPPSWRPLPVDGLEDSAGRDVIEEICGEPLAREHGAAILAHAAGNAQQLIPQALAYQVAAKRERLDAIRPTLQSSASKSFATPYTLLDDEARTVLHAVSFLRRRPIDYEELELQLLEPTGWSAEGLRDHLDACLELKLLEYAQGVRMHGLVAQFLEDLKTSTDFRRRLKRVRGAQSRRFLDLARSVSKSPSNAEAMSRFALFTSNRSKWASAWVDYSGAALSEIGTALLATGRFEEALPWYLQAVEETEQGDADGRIDPEQLSANLHGVGICLSRQGRFEEALCLFRRAVEQIKKAGVNERVDHVSLASSLHQVGFCYSSSGCFEEALIWHKRAIEERELGDVHGRVDHERLSASLYEIAACYSRRGRFEEALQWCKRAVDEAERGDIHARVDREILGSSLHEVGACYAGQGRFDEALPWHRRAVEEKERGDLHGRVHHMSLGLSLHQVGYCLSSLDRFEEALPWYRRAIEEKELGDVHERVDHVSLGKSLHQVGLCLSNLDRFEQAWPWYRRAVEQKEKGDLHGRVDYESLALSLNTIGMWHSNQGRVEEALPWYRRAVEEAERGDVHGHVDNKSLAGYLESLASCLSGLERGKEARTLLDRVRRTRGKGGSRLRHTMRPSEEPSP